MSERPEGRFWRRHPALVRNGVRALRQSVVSIAVLLCAGAAAYASWHGVRHVDQGQPDPVYQVDAGTVPVMSPRWTSHSGTTIVPNQALGRFTPQTTPVAGYSDFVEQLDLVPGQDGTVSASSADGLRYVVKLIPVQTTPTGTHGFTALTGLDPGALIVAHYILSLGSGDVVRAEAPSTRLLDYPSTPPKRPVIVELAAHDSKVAITVQDMGPGWSAEVFPVDTDVQIALQATKRPQTFRARYALPNASTYGVILRSDDRPTLNLGWLIVRDPNGVIQDTTALRY